MNGLGSVSTLLLGSYFRMFICSFSPWVRLPRWTLFHEWVIQRLIHICLEPGVASNQVINVPVSGNDTLSGLAYLACLFEHSAPRVAALNGCWPVKGSSHPHALVWLLARAPIALHDLHLSPCKANSSPRWSESKQGQECRSTRLCQSKGFRSVIKISEQP